MVGHVLRGLGIGASWARGPLFPTQQLEYRNQSLASIQAQKMKDMPAAAGGRIHEGKALSVLVI